MENTKYKLIHKKTNQETICEKVIVDGYDYYVSDETVGFTYNKPTYNSNGRIGLAENRNSKKVIATNNPNINIPKVVDCVDKHFLNVTINGEIDKGSEFIAKTCFKAGYKKSQEIHPFSEDDMIEFSDWKDTNYKYHNSLYISCEDYYSIPLLNNVKHFTVKELLEIWKSQRIKILYYE